MLFRSKETKKLLLHMSFKEKLGSRKGKGLKKSKKAHLDLDLLKKPRKYKK